MPDQNLPPEYKSLTTDLEDLDLNKHNKDDDLPAPESAVPIKSKEKKESAPLSSIDWQKNAFPHNNNQSTKNNNLWTRFNIWLEDQGRVPLTQKIFFVQNLSIMLKAGLSLGQSMAALSAQSPNKKLKKIIEDVSINIEKGKSFADALRVYPKDFDDLFINMVASGEASGNLEDVLKQVHLQMKRTHELISKVRGAMIYPTVVIIAMVGIGAGMIIFVMPKFISIFEELNATLPLPTRILIGVSNFVQNNGLMVALTLIVTITALIKILRTSKGKRFLHKMFLKLPVVAPIVQKINLAKFARTVSSLIKTDIPIVKSLKITAYTLGNIYYKEALLEASEKIKKGAKINEILREHPSLFPPTITQMVTVGEDSGSIDEVLSQMADFYEEEVDQTMKNLPSIIEPVLMLVLGVGVGFMAVSVLMPMYSMSEAI